MRSLVIGLMGAGLASSPAIAQSFQGLGFLSGAQSHTNIAGISADGSTIIGGQRLTPSDSLAFRWTIGSGMQPLGTLPGMLGATLRDVSADGSAIAGLATNGSGFAGFRWTESGGFQNLGFFSQTDAISGDGLTVLGQGTLSGEIWRSDTGWTSLPGGYGVLTGYGAGGALSSDGSIIAATVGQSGSFVTEAARWTPGGVETLGLLPGGVSSAVGGMSSNGEVVVGGGESTSRNVPSEAFRWSTDSAGMSFLGDLLGGDSWSFAYDVSNDGRIVIGEGTDAIGASAFIWDETNGIRALQDVLTNDYDLDLDGWRLTSARGISDDGLTITGIGINPDGLQEGWIVTIPAPSTFAAFGLLAFAGSTRRRR